MPALPAEGTVRAAFRVARLLRNNTYRQTFDLLLSSAQYSDMTATQYVAGFDLLRHAIAIEPETAPADLLRMLSDRDLARRLLGGILLSSRPIWLEAADGLLGLAWDDLPQDVYVLAEALDLTAADATSCVKTASGLVDLEARQLLGAAGEKALVNLLRNLPDATVAHVSLETDAAGYDVLLRLPDVELHIEVKSTYRRDMPVIYLSRHEYEVSQEDPRWALVCLCLDHELDVRAVGSLVTDDLRERVPIDRGSGSEWQTVRIVFAPGQLVPGIPALLGTHAREGLDVLASGREENWRVGWFLA